jgi:uncharacterized membrane protein
VVTTAAPAPARTQAQARPRIDAVDWLRGLAVVLMIQTHLYDAWCSRAAKLTVAYGWTRFWGGMPSRLFLLIVGVAMAIRYEAQIAKGVERKLMVRVAVKRGLEVLALAYAFRAQEYLLGGAYDWHDLFRVDILNCIGSSMIGTALISAPRRGRPQTAIALVAAAICVALGPIVGPAHFPTWLPRPLTSYFGGQRPMSWFPVFPWLAWPLVGVALGHWWVRAGVSRRRQAMAFVLTGCGGIAMSWAASFVRRTHPYIIHYPSELVQQMGPGTFFYRLGYMGPLALTAYAVTTLFPNRFSVMRQLGQTSLLVYWVHVELCYGLLFKRLHGRLSMPRATVALVLMIAAMLGLSLLRTRYRRWRRVLPRVVSSSSSAPASRGAPVRAE